MKRFKRSTRKPEKASTPRRQALPWGLSELLPGLLACLAGLLAAVAVLAFALREAQQHQHEQLVDAWSQGQVGALQQALRTVQTDLQNAAREPALLAALASGEPDAMHGVERRLAAWPGMVAARLARRDQMTADESGAAPIGFAVLDLVRRAESGQQPPPEAYRVGNRWLLYQVAAVHVRSDQPAIGTLLLVSELDRLFGSLPPQPAEAGQLRLIQQFSGAAAQPLLQRGIADEHRTPLLFDLGNPNWTLTLQPGPALAAPAVTPTLIGLAALLALVGAVFGLQLSQGLLQQRHQREIRQLHQLAEELSTGKPIKIPSLGQPLLDSVARLLVRLHPSSAAANPLPSAGSPSVRPEPISRPDDASEDAEPLFQDSDMLDFFDEEQDLLGLDTTEQETAMTRAKAPQLPASIFRAYDIRGVVGDTLTSEAAYWIGRAIGSESLARGEANVSVGRDGRLSGPELVSHLIQGLADCGCTVSDIGMVPTPVLYFATHLLEGKSGVMLTGSHNPPNYNGFKIVVAGDTLANEQIQALRRRIETNDLAEGVGQVVSVDVLDRYVQRIRDDIALARPLKVVVDCGNGVAGVVAPQLIETLGCQVIPLFCDVDGNFPNHHPDPGKLENLEDLIEKVRATGADVGLAFDGDGDRVGVVTNKGSVIYPDRLLMLFAKDVVSRNPGADIIFDVKCTRRLTPLISGYGGRPVMWKTGHSLIKKKMKESGALLAGEMSGHIFFKERWYGFDDGIYSAVRLLEILSQDKRDAELVFSAFPSDVSTPEINITVTEESKFTIIETLQRDAQWGEANLTTLDGVRVDYPKGWGLVRASNTTPVLVLRFEADSEEEMRRIQGVFRTQLLNVAPDLTLPF